jgi:hypothetical protein
MGVRVNTSELGEGGADEPPDEHSPSPAEPVLGDAAARRAGQVRRLAAEASAAQPTGASDGFYAATQAQAARLPLAAAAPSGRSAPEAALPREQIPLAYRASVKRYFLLEHSNER